MKRRFIVVPNLLAALILITAVGLSFLESQEIPRGESVYIQGFGKPTVWHPFSPSVTGGTMQFLYNQLFYYNPMKDAWLPWIAQGFEAVDRRTLRIFIRPEAKWSDGRPITAYDVEYTYYVTTQVKLGPGAGCWDYIEYIKAVGDKVVEVRALEPVNYFQLVTCSLGFAPFPKHILEPVFKELGTKIAEWRNDDLEKQVVSGPYKLLMFDDTRIVYHRIDNWWGRDVFGLPAPKYLVLMIFRDNPTSAAQLEAGLGDWNAFFTPAIWELFEKGIGTWFDKEPYYIPWGAYTVYINYMRKELSSPELRRAIAYAIPYKDIIEKAWSYYSMRASFSLVNDYFPQYREYVNVDLCIRYWGTADCRPATDLERARKILDEAVIVDRDGDGIRELPDGTELSGLTLAVPYGWTDFMVATELIVSNLKKIGIDIEPHFPDFTVWWQNIIDGRYDMVLAWIPAWMGFEHPWNMYRASVDPRLPPPSGNWARYNNPEVPKLIDAAATTADPLERKRIYSILQEIIYRDVPFIPTHTDPHWYIYDTRHWVGWPNEKNPWWTPVRPHDVNSITILFGIARKGETPTIPRWTKTVDEGGQLIPSAKLYNEFAKVVTPRPTPTPTPGVTTVTVTAVQTVTTTSVVTSTVTTTRVDTVTTTKVETVTDWTTTTLLAVVLLIIGIAVGYIIKRK
ncbi:MAG: ABC transporter substrate-binding protein [Ignisphaera sp.]|nr:ABC transporter substrate-binding protein [Ignisphaera sp.]MDW8085599.1 ABC transporter substrate-binding protein [Ignisphaera sp.]